MSAQAPVRICVNRLDADQSVRVLIEGNSDPFEIEGIQLPKDSDVIKVNVPGHGQTFFSVDRLIAVYSGEGEKGAVGGAERRIEYPTRGIV